MKTYPNHLYFDAIAKFSAALVCAASFAANSAEQLDEWIYTVAPGDTLIGLSARLMKPSMDWTNLQQHNRFTDPQRIRPGARVRIPVAWLRSDATVAKIIVTQGSVVVRRGLTTIEASSVGTDLLPGDRIETGSQSTLAVQFADGSRMVVAPNSKVLLENLLVYGKSGITETRLKIEEGAIDSKVKPMSLPSSKYVVTTPVFNLGVRGTEFRARFDPKTQLAFNEVLEGNVATQGRTTEIPIGAGFGTLALINTEPKPPIKLLDAPQLRGLARNFDQLPLAMAWEPEPNASGYRAKVFQNQALERQLLEGVFEKPAAGWAELPDGSYVLQVRSIDMNGLEGAGTTRDFVLKARPFAPKTSLPANGSKVFDDEVTFKWSEPLAAEKFRLQIATSMDFTLPLFDQKNIVGSEFKQALAPGNYFWRIASIATGENQGPFGDKFSFVQYKLPVSPAFDAPAIGKTEIALHWIPNDQSKTFIYQISSDPQFSQSLVTNTTSKLLAIIAKPAPGVYFLRFKSVDSEGVEGLFGIAKKFTIE
jgi:hypothetical protein